VVEAMKWKTCCAPPRRHDQSARQAGDSLRVDQKILEFA